MGHDQGGRGMTQEASGWQQDQRMGRSAPKEEPNPRMSSYDEDRHGMTRDIDGEQAAPSKSKTPGVDEWDDYEEEDPRMSRYDQDRRGMSQEVGGQQQDA